MNFSAFASVGDSFASARKTRLTCVSANAQAKTMKAAVYYETGAPNVLRYEDVPDPECPSNGIVIDVKAISIEGGDVLNRAGGMLVGKPHVVGYQAAGVVREVGAESSGFVVGDRVVTVAPFGSHAARRAVPTATAWAVPAGLDLALAACVPIPFGTADDCLFEFGRLKHGETVLIQGGAGGVGLAAIQLAKRAGARVLATASADAKLTRLREFGMDEGINYASGDLVAAVMQATNNRGVDLVVDPVGGDVLAQSLQVIGYRGRVVTVGNASRVERRYDIRTLAAQNQSVTGVFLGAEITTARVRNMIARHLEDVAAGTLRVVIDKQFPLRDAAAAHAHIESRNAFGRVLLVP
jgi:NADPH:quinone reductase